MTACDERNDLRTWDSDEMSGSLCHGTVNAGSCRTMRVDLDVSVQCGGASDGSGQRLETTATICSALPSRTYLDNFSVRLFQASRSFLRSSPILYPGHRRENPCKAMNAGCRIPQHHIQEGDLTTLAYRLIAETRKIRRRGEVDDRLQGDRQLSLPPLAA